jgi:hypothetical protein
LLLSLLASFCASWLWFGGAAVLLAAPVVLALAPLWRLAQAVFCAQTMRIEGETVVLRWREGLRWRTLRQPISAYAGVARWSGNRLQSIPLFTWSHRWWVVALVHREFPETSVPLLLSESFEAVISTQAAAAEAFGLPVLLESPHGEAWRPRLVADLTRGLGERLREIWAGQASRLALPQQADFLPGGWRAWGQEISDRWLWLLFLAPLGGLWGGLAGLLCGAFPALLVYAALWGYWRLGDGWGCDGETLLLTQARRWGAQRRLWRLPVGDVIAARVVRIEGSGGVLEIETPRKAYQLRLGQTPPQAAQDSLEILLHCLRGRSSTLLQGQG